MYRIIVILAVGVLAVGAWLLADSDIDPAKKFAWTENAGWTNWRDAAGGTDGVEQTATYLMGFIWGENVGWINVGNGPPADGVHYANTDGGDFGVNVDPETGDLFGLAWGENIGWINSDTSSLGEDRARFHSCEHRFLGYAWGENIGWINLNDATHFVAVGPCGFGDYDCDGDQDLDDYAAFTGLFQGPEVIVDCPAFDDDADGDVDLSDFAAFQRAFTHE